jgi:hypothetical protein
MIKSFEVQGVQMSENRRQKIKGNSVHATAWRMVRALALGMLLGGALTLFSWRSDVSSLLCIALQSAFSAMVLAVLVFDQHQDMSLYIEGLPLLPESERGDCAQGNRKHGVRSIETELGPAAL